MFITGAIAVAGFGLSVVGMAGAGAAASAQADASTALGRAKLKEQNANANVDRFVRTLNNQKKGRALDQNVIAAGKNAERAAQAGVRGKVEAQLAEAEGLGAYVAHSAMTGQRGGTLDIMEQTIRLRDSRQGQQRDEALRLMQLDAADQQGALLRQGLDSLEMGVLGGGVDNSAHIQPGTNYASALGSMLSGKTGDTLASILASMGQSTGISSSFQLSQPTSFVNPNQPTKFSFSTPKSFSWGIQ